MYSSSCFSSPFKYPTPPQEMQIFFFLRFYLFTFRERGREGERKGEKHQYMRDTSITLPLTCPQLGTCLTTQACALTGNRTGDLSVHRPVLSPLSRPSQGQMPFFLNKRLFGSYWSAGGFLLLNVMENIIL